MSSCRGGLSFKIDQVVHPNYEANTTGFGTRSSRCLHRRAQPRPPRIPAGPLIHNETVECDTLLEMLPYESKAQMQRVVPLLPERSFQQSLWYRLTKKTFILIFFLTGVDIQKHQRISYSVFIILLRIVIAVLFTVYACATVMYICYRMPAQPSVLDWVRSLYVIVNWILAAFSCVHIIQNERVFADVLFPKTGLQTRFYPRRFVVASLFWLPSSCALAYQAFQLWRSNEHILIKAGLTSAVVLLQAPQVAICLYTQCEEILISHLRDLHLTAQTVLLEEQVPRVAWAKNAIRRNIQCVNDTLGNILLLIFIRIFTVVAMRFGDILLWSWQPTDSYIQLAYMLNGGLLIAQLYDISRLGSAVIQEAQRTEMTLYEYSPLAPKKMLAELRSILAYREHFDALLISNSFVNNRATIFTYLGTMFTCIAILLQFDYAIMRALDEAKQNSKYRSMA